MNLQKNILDVCCGSRMFWFNKNHANTIYGDIREETHVLCDGRSLEINPDMKMDFTNLPFENESFSLVVFDPPNLVKLGANSWMAKKYGILKNTWQDDIRKGFSECLRVLKTDGVLIFKWNETDVTTKEILSLCEEKPLFGHISGKRSNTHWVTFMKTINS